MPNYGSDQVLRDTLAAEIRTYREFSETEKLLQEKRNALEQQFYAENKELIDRNTAAKQEMERLRQAFNTYVNNHLLQSGRRQFLNGMIRARPIKKPGQYDEMTLKVWARKYPEALKIAKDKQIEAIRELYMTKPDTLEVDIKAAEKLAIETYDNGEQVFDDSPVPVEWRATETSAEMFLKVMGTISVEVDVDERSAT